MSFEQNPSIDSTRDSDGHQGSGPDGHRSKRVRNGLAAFKELASLPIVSQGSIVSSPDYITVHTTLSAASFETSTTRHSTQSRILHDKHDGTFTTVSDCPPVPLGSDIVHFAYSPSGTKTIAFSKRKEGGLLVELHTLDHPRSRLEAVISDTVVTSLYSDETFGIPAWSADEQHVAFVAEAAPPEKPIEEKYRWTMDFGETFVGKRRPCIHIASLQSADAELYLRIRRITAPGKQSGVSWTQPVFGPQPDPKTLVLYATGYETLADGFRLGPVYCTNRPSSIWRLEITLSRTNASTEVPPEAVKMEVSRTPGIAKTSPRICGDKLVYVAYPEGGEHVSCASLFVADAQSHQWQQSKEIVCAVDSPTTTADFPGLYPDAIPAQCSLKVGGRSFFVLSSIWQSRSVPLAIDLDSGHVHRIAIGNLPSTGSIHTLATDGMDRVLFTTSALNREPRLNVWRALPQQSKQHLLEGRTLDVRESNQGASDSSENAGLGTLKNSCLSCFDVPSRSPTEVLLLSPSHSSHMRPELIIYAHGGPHGAFTDTFSPVPLAFVAAGFAVALINYTGSIGYGRKYIRKLLGRVGDLDVEDTREAAQAAKAVLGIPRAQKALYYGGSHAGLIGAHLSVRYPEEFEAVALRNPVIDIPSFVQESDIPDWCFFESGLPYSYARPPRALTPQTFQAMHKGSPIHFIHELYLDAERPARPKPSTTRIILGADDKRVPSAPGQDLVFCHAASGCTSGHLHASRDRARARWC